MNLFVFVKEIDGYAPIPHRLTVSLLVYSISNQFNYQHFIEEFAS